jgi:predicted Rossmann fold flavoprotein
MDVSRWFERCAPAERPTLHVDLLPDVPEDAVRVALQRAIAARPSERIVRCLPERLPARLAESLCAHALVAPDRRAAEVSKADRHALVLAMKRLTLPVAGTRGFDFAEVTAGGVALAEVEPATMESRRAPGLHVVGEILDVDGPIGGLNFQAAFATGEAAGLAV